MRIATVKGIGIYIHYSWVIALGLFTYFLAVSYFPFQIPGLGLVEHWQYALITTLAVFFSVVIHELAHSILALKFGISTKKITLYIFGGIATLEQSPKKPVHEILVAAAGPAVSLFIGFAMLFFFKAGAMEGYIAVINITMGLINLAPVLPLDGGRILRGILWKFNRNYIKATRKTHTIGGVITHLFVGAGLILLFLKNIDGFWFFVIGIFLKMLNVSEHKELLQTEAIYHTNVMDLCVKKENIISVPEDITIGKFVSDYFVVYGYHSYPATNKDREVIGMVTYPYIKDYIKRKDYDKPIRDVVHPFSFSNTEEMPIIAPSTNCGDALTKMIVTHHNSLYVFSGKEFKGMITKSAIIRAGSENY